MARYIDADMLYDKLDKMQTKRKECVVDYLEVFEMIEKTPTADVEEVKHGEWIQEWELEKGLEDNDEIPYIKCSLCGHMEWGIDKEMDITPNYCNECGAKMDGGKEE